MLTHSNLINNAYNIAQCMKLGQKDRLCIPVPFFHCFGCVIGTLAAVSVGATMVPVQEFNPETVLRTVEKEKCTALHGVPTMFIAELNNPNFENYDYSTLTNRCDGWFKLPSRSDESGYEQNEYD